MLRFPKMGLPQNGCFISRQAITMDDLRVALFQETPMFPINKNSFGVYAMTHPYGALSCRGLAIAALVIPTIIFIWVWINTY